MKFLIIEDDEIYLKAIKRGLLKEYGINIEVSHCDSIDSCKPLLEKNPDVILLDYYLKDTYGDTMQTIILQLKPKPHVIALSNQGDIDITVRLMRLGIDDYVVKSGNYMTKLITSIDRLLENDRQNKKIGKYKIVYTTAIVLFGLIVAFKLFEVLYEYLK